MRVAVLTSLYPSSVRPHEGIFAERRWSGMARRGHAVSVTQPLPRAPLAWLGPFVGRPHWLEIARMPREESREGLTVRRPRYRHVPGRALANARAFARVGVAALLAEKRPDVVVLDYAWPAAVAVEALRAARLPVVVHGRGSDVLQVAESEELARELAAALRRAGNWAAVSQDLVDAMDRLAGAPGRGRLVANGVDFELFAPVERGAARRRLGLDADGALVLVVGHLIPRKDPLLALEAFARGAPKDARIVFVGRGELESALRARIAALGLDARASVVGVATPQTLRDWYGAADVLLLASSREGRPNVVLEALASGRPVVATAAGGTGELLAASGGAVPGALVTGREPESLGRALAAVLAAPPGPQTCRAAVAHLSWDASLDALERVLADAVAQGERG